MAIVLSGFAYYMFVKQSIRFKRDWKKTFNEPHPNIKNPYTVKHAIIFPIVIFGLLIPVGIFGENIKVLQDQRNICIETIQEWEEVRGLVTITYYHAFINNEYDLTFERPQQYGIDDCFTIYKYKLGGWTLNKLE